MGRRWGGSAEPCDCTFKERSEASRRVRCTTLIALREEFGLQHIVWENGRLSVPPKIPHERQDHRDDEETEDTSDYSPYGTSG